MKLVRGRDWESQDPQMGGELQLQRFSPRSKAPHWAPQPGGLHWEDEPAAFWF